MKKSSFVLFSAAVVLATACNFIGREKVTGNGNIKTEQRNVSAFSSVDVSGSMNVHIMQSENGTVKIEADENLMPYIETSVKSGTLVVKTKDGYNLEGSKPIIVYAAGPVFKDIDVSGSGDIIGDNVITGNEALGIDISGSGNIKMEVALPKVEVEISGSGNADLRGSAKDFSAAISGSGSVNCFELITENTSLDLSGASDAKVFASKKLDVEVSGSGDVQYKGGASVNQSISGSGSVKKVD